MLLQRPSPADARVWQVLVLATLLLTGAAWLGFGQSPATVLLVIATSVGVQFAGSLMRGERLLDPWSALITGLSLAILLRADAPWLMALAAILAIGSKFVIRLDGHHLYNPSNFAIAVLLLATDRVWISPGQWGAGPWLAFLVAALAVLVLARARTLDIAIAFLVAYGACLLARAIHLGDPLAIPLHQMQSGALLLFAFFMITDPRTVPAARSGRIAFAILVASLAVVLQFALHMPEGLMLALFFSSPILALPSLVRGLARALPSPGAVAANYRSETR